MSILAMMRELGCKQYAQLEVLQLITSGNCDPQFFSPGAHFQIVTQRATEQKVGLHVCAVVKPREAPVCSNGDCFSLLQRSQRLAKFGVKSKSKNCMNRKTLDHQ